MCSFLPTKQPLHFIIVKCSFVIVLAFVKTELTDIMVIEYLGNKDSIGDIEGNMQNLHCLHARFKFKRAPDMLSAGRPDHLLATAGLAVVCNALMVQLVGPRLLQLFFRERFSRLSLSKQQWMRKLTMSIMSSALVGTTALIAYLSEEQLDPKHLRYPGSHVAQNQHYDKLFSTNITPHHHVGSKLRWHLLRLPAVLRQHWTDDGSVDCFLLLIVASWRGSSTI
ncbi:uncharacterized protein LOC144880826 isoform X6 [Branchiostoma floridae x Branchiostoma japonicum]